MRTQDDEITQQINTLIDFFYKNGTCVAKL
jgi:hypothetical protein